MGDTLGLCLNEGQVPWRGRTLDRCIRHRPSRGCPEYTAGTRPSNWLTARTASSA